MRLLFEWDPNKAQANAEKHTVSFGEAATVFGDMLSITYRDPDHSVVESRHITIGMSQLGRLLIIAHVDQGDRIRIISARETTRSERKLYEEG